MEEEWTKNGPNGNPFVIIVNREMFNLRPGSCLNPSSIYFYKNPAGKAKSGNENMFFLGGGYNYCFKYEFA